MRRSAHKERVEPMYISSQCFGRGPPSPLCNLTHTDTSDTLERHPHRMTVAQSVPCISLRDFDARRAEITTELMNASTNIGFFTLKDHGIPEQLIQSTFQLSKDFFDLDDGIKAETALNGKNMGWEKNAQIRPSTGTADMKESMQLQFARMEGMWPSDENIPDFRSRAEVFMKAVQE